MTDLSTKVPSSDPSRRRNGHGGIETDPATGRCRGNYYGRGGERVRLPWCEVRRDAEEQLQAALELTTASGEAIGSGLILRAWGEDFLDRRELSGHRAAQADRNRWKQYVLPAAFIDWPLESISRRDVKRWLAALAVRKTFGRGTPPKAKSKHGKLRAPPRKPDRFLAWQTRKHALVILRKAFDAAIDDELVSDDFANPCHGLSVKKSTSTEHACNFLQRDELEAIQRVATTDVLPLIEFAVATGLRQGELRALREEDVHLDAPIPYIVVRYGGTPRKPTKGGLPRDVPLLPMAQRALRAWRAFRATWCKENDKGLVFPAQRGGYRSCGKVLGRRHQKIWKDLLGEAGIRRHLVWHDLRHTCATALLGGYFGKKWRLEEIQQLLGHADIETTQIYAHALKESLLDAAKETLGDITPPRRGDGEKDD